MSTFKVAPEPSPVASQETGKKRSSRIALDYFKHGTYLDRCKNGLALVLLVLAVAYVAFILAADRRAVSRGPVANVHAAWDNNCQACHESFSGVGLGRLWGASVAHTTSDEKCQTCHLGTDHHKTATDSVSCGGCHRDHRGRDASLVRLADGDCTSCHANLGQHLKDGKDPSYHSDPKHEYSNAITSFAKHPEFAVLTKKDPGNIKFSHATHLQPGQTVGWTLGKIEKDVPEAVKRFRDAPFQKDKTDGAAVVLDCVSCHVLDAGDIGGKGTKASGAYYQPISFDANCKGCHALTFDKDIKTSVKAPNGNDVSVFMQAPHRLQPGDLDPFLWGVYANTYLDGDKGKKLAAALTDQHQPSRPLPGKGPAATKQDIDHRVEMAKETLGLTVVDPKKKIVRNQCLKCHEFENPATQRRVKASNIPVVWQTHAKFNHVAHRAMQCIACHEKAYPFEADGKTLKDEKNFSAHNHDVMLPSIATCQKCHAPAGRESGQPTGGVRHDCTGCHTYHNGDHAAQGLGAAARNPAIQLKNEDFLGARKK
jgi:hypothetical protein